MSNTRLVCLVGALALGVGCGGRTVNVRTGETAATRSGVGEPSIAFTNNLTQGVNVYVVTGTAGGDLFLRQVAGGASESLLVRGVAGGTSVGLKATTIDGTRTYTKQNVVLTPGYVWQVP
jgi:hypothetical protein